MSPGNPGVDVNSTRKSYCLPSSIVSSADTWCGGASSSREPSSIPAGYASHTGYQYDSISRVAGQRELAPPSKFSNEGGLRKRVRKGMSVKGLIVASGRLMTKLANRAPGGNARTVKGVNRSSDGTPGSPARQFLYLTDRLFCCYRIRNLQLTVVLSPRAG